MKNKNMTVVFAVVILALFLAACGNEIPQLAEDEDAMVTEYAAKLLLSHSGNYHSRLVDTSVVPEDIQKEEATENNEIGDNAGLTDGNEEQQQENVGTENTELEINDGQVDIEESKEPEEPAMTIAQVLGLVGVDVQYTGYELCDSYPNGELSPENMFFAMSAAAGSKLLILHLNVSNNSEQTILLDTISIPAKYKVVLNGRHTQNSLVTMLEDDFSAIKREIAAGDSLATVIVAELSEEKAYELETVGLEVKYADNKTIITQ